MCLSKYLISIPCFVRRGNGGRLLRPTAATLSCLRGVHCYAI
ncbi:hypothetical protein BRADI_4g09127v3 [Brachypodium distachyon]|uniref:Uncharacterized protein n=1 Tax=Brachypodium distachyon TaxID=15368 RepID=A0A2K2CLF8_BRADI|nr:hypothetical protein BRADI_4g09127v3 [Brachypodium distachyon]